MDYWTRHARHYDRVTLFLNRNLPALARTVAEDLTGCRRVLELAAGTGLMTLALAPTVAELVATDPSAGMLERLRGRVESAGFGHVTVRAEDALAIGEPDGAFDAVVAANLLHLLPDPRAALDEMGRVLRPGGKLAVPTFAHGETWPARTLSRLAKAFGFPVVTRFRGSALGRLVASAGFEVRRDEVVRGLFPIRYVLAERLGDVSRSGRPRPEPP